MQMSSEQASRSRVDVAGKMKARGKRPEDLIALSLVLLMAASVPAHEPPVDHIDRRRCGLRMGGCGSATRFHSHLGRP